MLLRHPLRCGNGLVHFPAAFDIGPAVQLVRIVLTGFNPSLADLFPLGSSWWN
jgi:hypothetical protein